MDIWIWSRPYLGQSGLNRSRYNEVLVFDEFSKGLVLGEFFENITGQIFLILSHKWVPIYIWIWSDHIWGSRDSIVADIMKFEFLTNSQRVSTREFLENFTGKFRLIFSYKWDPMDIWIWSWQYLGQSGLNRNRYNEVRFFEKFSTRLVHRNFSKISLGSFF